MSWCIARTRSVFVDFDGRTAAAPTRRRGDERMDTGLRQALARPPLGLGVVTATVAGPDASAWPLPPRDGRRRLATHHPPRPQ